MYEPEKTQGRNVVACRNQDFLSLFTESGRGLLFFDPLIPGKLFTLNDSLEKVGDGVFELLQHSRVLSDDEFQAIFKSGEVQRKREDWDRAITQQFGYKTKGKIYKKMLSCSIRELNGVLTITPTDHKKMESWQGMQDVEPVVLPASSSSEAVGLALNEAFERCRSQVN